MCQEVAKACLYRLVIENRNRPISSTPEFFSPVMETPGLASDIGVQVVHKSCEGIGSRSGKEKVYVIRSNRKRMKSNGV
jgi:hypothetical protein